MAILNNEAAAEYAKELTITAMEHNMIAASTDPAKTGENIFKCFKTLYEKFADAKAE